MFANQKIQPILEFEYVLMFDGCSKGNPGEAGAGAVLYKNEQEIWASCQYVGSKETNNVAEYSGLVLGLEHAFKEGISELLVQGDSMLVIKQMNGDFKVKSRSILPLFNLASELKSRFENIVFQHVYRDKNKRADELSNMAIQLDIKTTTPVEISSFLQLKKLK